MPAFDKVLSKQDVANIRAYVLSRRDLLAEEQKAAQGDD
jgi:mono/diheme cytochrome c family protein